MTQPAGRPSSSLHQAVGELSGKLDTILTIIHPEIVRHDARITSLESFRGRFYGGATVVGFLVSVYEAYSYVHHRG